MEQNEDTLSKRDRQEQNRKEKAVRLRKASNTKQLLIWVIVILGIAALILVPVVLSRMGNTLPLPPHDTIAEHDWIKGNSASQVVFVEYGDFQCPACRTFSLGTLPDLMKHYGDRVAFVYRHFPLRGIHPNAFDSARAAEAAGNQGKFWEMHDLLYQKQAEWSDLGRPYLKFQEYAGLLELDIERFEEDYDSSELAAKIKAHERSAAELSLRGTPSVVLSGEIMPSLSSDALKKKLDELL